MALTNGSLALAIIGVITTGIVAVVTIVAIYKCAKIAIKMWYSSSRDHHTPIANGGGSSSSRGGIGGADADVVEMGNMSHFIEGLQNERPVRFSARQLRAFTKSYAHKVGSGGFGVVYRGVFPSGAPVAVKVLNSTLGKRAEEQFMAEVLNSTLGKRAEEQFMAEVGTIGRTYHINLVRLYGFCFDADVKALVYEYMEKGSLDRYLFDSSPSPAAERIGFEKLHEIAVGTAKAVRYLHEECAQRIIHYDIKPENVLLGAGMAPKPENVLLGAGMAPKVSDFGLAKLCDREDTHLTITGARGTPGYAAPELWMPLPVTHKCDVYSYGMLLFEMLGRRRNLELGGGGSQEWYPRWVWHRFEAGETEAVLARATAAAAGGGREREKAERVCMVALCTGRRTGRPWATSCGCWKGRTTSPRRATLSIVAIVFICHCAEIAMKMCIANGGGSSSSRGGAAAADADVVEMGSMSRFIEGLQNELPVRFSAQQLRAFTNNYAHKVGSGGFGVVYRGRFPSGVPVAVKVLNSTLGKRAEEQFMAEDRPSMGNVVRMLEGEDHIAAPRNPFAHLAPYSAAASTPTTTTATTDSDGSSARAGR
uniref:Protein kinase domain-containing protein n=1 Tax=Oryza rufipogon TaxID=4529 RepID=A0A0E0PF23_ORYRU